jgi:hypothetical protein
VLQIDCAAVRQAAFEAYAAGLSVVRIREDGEKRPVGTWKCYQTTRATEAQIEVWYEDAERFGVGCVTGAVSGGVFDDETGELIGGLECLEFDDRATYTRFVEAAQSAGLGPLVTAIEAGYVEDTPKGGVHWLYRCRTVAGNTKLAQRPDPTPDNPRNVKPLIETRGEGGFLVLAPSHGPVHPSGRPYILRAGGFDSIAVIATADREDLFELARSFDETPKPDAAPEDLTGRAGGDGIKPGTAYNEQKPWGEILIGWTKVFTEGGEDYWRRPGRDRGVSATTNYKGSGVLYVFTTSTPFTNECSYSKFAAYAVLNHAGDFSKAAKALFEQGYGDRVRRDTATPDRNGRHSDGPPPPKTERYPSDPTDEELGLTPLENRVAQEVEWLWPDRIPLGKITLLVGEPGIGKSYATLDIAAILTRGAVWPDRLTEGVKPARVIIASAEDGIDDTIVPRLDRLGANRKLIHTLGIARFPNGTTRPFTIADIERLEAIMKKHPGTRLIILDPIPAFLGHGIDDHKNAELRALLGPLAEFAERYKVAILALTHFAKNASARAAARIIGSVAYNAAARVSWCLALDPENDQRRLLMPVKNNLSPVRTALAFTIDDEGVVKWERDTFTANVNEILSAGMGGGPQEKRRKIIAWLQQLLSAGPLPSEVVIEKGRSAGFGKNMIWEVKDRAHIRSFNDTSTSGGWIWKYDPPNEANPTGRQTGKAF